MRLFAMILILYIHVYGDERGNFIRKSGVKPVDNSVYVKECAACHMAYQAGLLPARSWKKLMNDLKNHFNTDARLDDEDFKIISTYLEKNSAENALEYKRSSRINRSLNSDDVPIAITEIPYIIKKHRKLKEKLISQKEVKGLFNCNACHTSAEKGIYSERYINIPNYGRWDD